MVLGTSNLDSLASKLGNVLSSLYEELFPAVRMQRYERPFDESRRLKQRLENISVIHSLHLVHLVSKTERNPNNVLGGLVLSLVNY